MDEFSAFLAGFMTAFLLATGFGAALEGTSHIQLDNTVTWRCTHWVTTVTATSNDAYCTQWTTERQPQ